MAASGSHPLMEVEFEGEEEDARGLADTSMTLVGRFLTNRPVRAHIMKDRMAGVWRPGKGVSIREAGQGIFLFQFFHPLDVQKVLKQGPWSFDKNLLILSVIPAGVVPHDVPLFQIPFWVQVHNVPTGFMSETVGKHVGNTIGSFLEYDPKNSSEFWKLYMRVWVLLDVRKPLVKGLRLKRKGGEAKEVSFKYERLDVFCYLCGLLGHADVDCPNLFDMQTDDGRRDWGPELKAENRRGGSSGGARWLREENQPWESPNSVMNAGANHCSAFPNFVDRNNGGVMGGPKPDSHNSHNDDVTQLVEAFKNPALLFPRQLQKEVVGEMANNDKSADNGVVMMEAEVAVGDDRKRDREDGSDGSDVAGRTAKGGVSKRTVVGVSLNSPQESEGSFLSAGPGGRARREK